MRILQLLPVLHFGDAVGNNAVALLRALRTAGYESDIYAENIEQKIPVGLAKPISELEIQEEDIAILHLAIGTKLNYDFAEYPCKKIVFYHNITPPYFFGGKDKAIAKFCEEGLESARFLSDKVDYCIADSEFNKRDLQNMGYRCPIDILPILVFWEDYEKEPNPSVLKMYSDERTNIIFVGRVVQNKKQEDIIEAFSYYKKYYNPHARLFFVGNYDSQGSYYLSLQEYAHRLNISDVFFTGKVSFEEMLAYYQIADVFLCMSEHEGFCVPLLESMYFRVPIIAYDSSAVPDTLGGSGLVIPDKNPLITAGIMNQVVLNQTVRNSIIENQDERLKDFSNRKIVEKFLTYIQNFLKKVG